MRVAGRHNQRYQSESARGSPNSSASKVEGTSNNSADVAVNWCGCRWVIGLPSSTGPPLFLRSVLLAITSGVSLGHPCNLT
jgi:hypothetical protein